MLLIDSALFSVSALQNRVYFANPITSEGSNLRGDVTESEAFLWFDEALIHVRAGSGGAGSSAVKFGKSRQHVAPSGGSGGKSLLLLYAIRYGLLYSK